jgi:hypothetical protein
MNATAERSSLPRPVLAARKVARIMREFEGDPDTFFFIGSLLLEGQRKMRGFTLEKMMAMKPSKRIFG